MNNKHQELIAEKVEDLISQGFCFQHEIITETGSYPKTKEALNKTLQDTIDTVLEEERVDKTGNLHDKVKRTFNGYGGVLGFTEQDLHNLVNNTLYKTPPNKV